MISLKGEDFDLILSALNRYSYNLQSNCLSSAHSFSIDGRASDWVSVCESVDKWRSARDLIKRLENSKNVPDEFPL